MMDIDEVPMRGDDGEREDEGRREVPEEDDMDLQMQDRMGGGGGGASASASPTPSQSVYWYQRWLQSQFASPKSGQSPRPVVSMDDADGEDFRDHDDEDFQREGGNTDHYSSRVREPLKRDQHGHNTRENEDLVDYEQPTKRRRVSFGDGVSSIIFGGVPALTERQQAVVEYTAPSTFTPLFYFLGFTPFAVTWVMVMYTSHFFQTLFTNFGPETKGLRYTMTWNIPPLPHTLMDTYVWNHSMISVMVLYPTMFCTENNGNAAYWLAVFFVMAQQQFYWQVSLKTHYCKNHKANVPHKYRSSMESYFLSCFLCYALAAGLFSLAKILEWPLLLYAGLVEFNLAPIYMLWDYLARVKKYAIAGGGGGGSSSTATGENIKKKN